MSNEAPSSSVTPPNINVAMAAINQGVEAIKKAQKNTSQGFMFRGIDDVYNALHDLFASNGVVCYPNAEKIEHILMPPNSKGNVERRVFVTMAFRFVAADGSEQTARTFGEGADFGDKATAKAMSVADKYCLLQTFKIPTHDLLDGDKGDPNFDASGAAREGYNAQYEGKSLAQLVALRDEHITAKSDMPPGLLGAIAEARAAEEDAGAGAAPEKAPRKPRGANKEKPPENSPASAPAGDAGKAPETAAKPPEKTPEPTTPPPQQKPQETAPAGDGKPSPLDYVITLIEHPVYHNRRLGDLALAHHEKLVTNWIGRYWDKINSNPEWVTEMNMILEALGLRGSKAGTPQAVQAARALYAPKDAAPGGQ